MPIGESLGGIEVTNNSAQPCSLSGQPVVTVLDTQGRPLALQAATYHRAPDPMPPTSPINLSAGGVYPQAVVLIDWFDWCGLPPSGLQFRIQFAGLPTPIYAHLAPVPTSAIPPCTNRSTESVFAVDYVRGWDANGMIIPGWTSP